MFSLIRIGKLATENESKRSDHSSDIKAKVALAAIKGEQAVK